VGEREGAKGGWWCPSPLVSTLVGLLLRAIRPQDLRAAPSMQGHGLGKRQGHGGALSLPPAYTAVVRALVLDHSVAERAPWLREQLRGYLGRVDPEALGYLEDAEELVRLGQEALTVNAPGVILTPRKWDLGSPRAGSWAGTEFGFGIGELPQVYVSLPLLHSVAEEHLIGAVIALWMSTLSPPNSTSAPISISTSTLNSG
ncbi:unnamed protein product, partial [Discosporangium mesarthrocarpum]